MGTTKFGWCLDGFHRIPTILRMTAASRPECPGSIEALACSCECHLKIPHGRN